MKYTIKVNEINNERFDNILGVYTDEQEKPIYQDVCYPVKRSFGKCCMGK